MQKALGRELGVYLSSFYLEKKGEKAFRRWLKKGHEQKHRDRIIGKRKTSRSSDDAS